MGFVRLQQIPMVALRYKTPRCVMLRNGVYAIDTYDSNIFRWIPYCLRLSIGIVTIPIDSEMHVTLRYASVNKESTIFPTD